MGLERVITILVDIRYHLTSLVAVFLSLGLGMVIGMSLAEDDTLRREQQNLIRSIEERVSMVQAENAHLLAQLDEVQTSLGDYERLIWDAGGQLFGRSLQDVQVTIVAEAAFHPAIEPWVKFLQLHGGEVRQLTWHRDRLTESAAGAADVAASGAEPYAALGRALAGMIWGEEVDQTLEALVASGVFHLDGAPAARGKPDIIVFVPDRRGLFAGELDAALQRYGTRAILAVPGEFDSAAMPHLAAERWTIVPDADGSLSWYYIAEAIASAVEEAEQHHIGLGGQP